VARFYGPHQRHACFEENQGGFPRIELKKKIVCRPTPMTIVKHVLEKKGRDVHTIHPDASVFDALKRMAENDIGSLVVLEGDKLVGIITERHYSREIALKGRTSSGTSVRDIMSTRVAFVRPEHSVEECMALMTAQAVRHLPVLEHNRVVGIVSIGDMVKSVIDDQKFIIEQLEHYVHGHEH
jgi:CBS domain-containing protein